MWYILSMSSLKCLVFAVHGVHFVRSMTYLIPMETILMSLYTHTHTQVSQAVAQLGNPIGVKALLYALEMAQSDLEPGQKLQVGGFLECLHTMKA